MIDRRIVETTGRWLSKKSLMTGCTLARVCMGTACIGACIEVRVPSRFACNSALSGAICAFEVHNHLIPVLPEVK